MNDSECPDLISYNSLEKLYTNVYNVDFTQPLKKMESSPTFHPMLLHIYDLFLHSSNPSFSPQHPQFSFPLHIIEIIQATGKFSPHLIQETLSSPNPANRSQLDNSKQHNGSFAPIHINEEEYIQRFLDILGSANAFASHLRQTILLSLACRSTRLNPSNLGSLSPDSILILMTTYSTIFIRIFLHFFIISQFYDISPCGSLNFSNFLNYLVNSKFSLFYQDIPQISSYNQDEITFLTTTLPTAFKTSPMYPGDDQDGIIFPLTINSDLSDSFTQHYTKLCNPSSTSQSHLKVPLSNIPFSIFVYMGLLNSIMVDLWGIFLNLLTRSLPANKLVSSHSPFDQVVTILFSSPVVPDNIFNAALRCLSRIPSCGNIWSRLFDSVNIVQCLNFKLHQLVRFPILIEDPGSSLIRYDALTTLELMVSFIKNITSHVNTQFLSPYLILGLHIVQIMFLMYWADQFTFTCSSPTTQLSKLSLPSSTTTTTNPVIVSSYHHRYTQSYQIHLNNCVPFESSTSSPSSTYQNPFTAALLEDSNNFRPQSEYFSQNLTECFTFLEDVAEALDTSSNLGKTIIPLLSPEFFSMLVSLILRYRAHPAPILPLLNFVTKQNTLTTFFRNLWYLLAEHITTIPQTLLSSSYKLLHFAPRSDVASQFNFTAVIPLINHLYSAQFYFHMIHLSPFNAQTQQKIQQLRTNLNKLDESHSISLILQLNNNNHALYRHQLSKIPIGQPSELPLIPLFLPDQHFPTVYTPYLHNLSRSRHRISAVADQMLSQQHKMLVEFISTHAHHIIGKKIDSTKLMIYSIPYVAIQLDFNRTLFHALSTFDWNASSNNSPMLSQPAGAYTKNDSFCINILQYIEIFSSVVQLQSTSKFASQIHPHNLHNRLTQQLYYVYTEAIIFIIMGFSFASFSTPLQNDPTIHLSATAQSCQFPLPPADIGISSFATYLPNISFSPKGTIWKSSSNFRDDFHSTTHQTLIQNDSYHQHIMSLYNNPQVLYSFKPKRFWSAPINYYSHSLSFVPDYFLQQESTGTIAIALEWSSAMVQHFIEFFIELLLNESSYEIISQIDFSDYKQPLAKEYIIDYIPPDPADWGNKDKWVTNLPPNCSDEDAFPLYKQFIPTKYQAQLPTLSTIALNPKYPDQLPHSIYNPDNSSRDHKSMVNYYNENISFIPSFVFNDDLYTSNDLRQLGFKTHSRGHLPYFYNLSTKDQDELFTAFSHDKLFTHPSLSNANLPSSLDQNSSSEYPKQHFPPTLSIPPHTHTTTQKNPAQIYEIDLTRYLGTINNLFPLNLEQSMSTNTSSHLQVQNFVNPFDFTLDQQTCVEPSSCGHEIASLLNRLRELLLQPSTTSCFNLKDVTFDSLPNLFPLLKEFSLFTPLVDQKVAESTSTFSTKGPYYSFKLLPLTFTIPSTLILNQLKCLQFHHQFNIHLNLNQFSDSCDSLINDITSPAPKFLSTPPPFHPLSHNLLFLPSSSFNSKLKQQYLFEEIGSELTALHTFIKSNHWRILTEHLQNYIRWYTFLQQLHVECP